MERGRSAARQRALNQDTTRRVKARRARVAFTLVELLVVIGIILVITSLIVGAVLTVRASSQRQAAGNTANQLHVALETFLTEKPIPTTPAEGYAGDGYLHDPKEEPRSLLQQLEHRELFGFDRMQQLDAQRRLIDPWQQPWNLVIGIGPDARGHLPSELAATELDDWQVVNARAGADARIYVYSYGPGNTDGSEIGPGQWIYNRVQ